MNQELLELFNCSSNNVVPNWMSAEIKMMNGMEVIPGTPACKKYYKIIVIKILSSYSLTTLPINCI